jgi:acetyl esterase
MDFSNTMALGPMIEAKLAPGYATILALHRFFARPGTRSTGDLGELRRTTSGWISRFKLSVDRSMCEVTDVAGWRVFRPTIPRGESHVFYLHGGGLVLYSIDDYDSLLTQLAMRTGSSVTGFHYGTAPEHGIDEIIDTLAEALDRRAREISAPCRVALAGDSIGAYLAIYFAVHKYPGRFSRLILINPVLDLIRRRNSYSIHGEQMFLTAKMMTCFQKICRAGQHFRNFDPFNLASPVIRLLPDIAVFSVEFDVLSDESHSWTEYLRARGVHVAHAHFQNLAHDFMLYAGAVPEAADAIELICDCLRRPAIESQGVTK